MSPPPVVQAQAETPSKPRNRRLRLWLAMGAGLLGLLCLGGAGIAVILYDEETKIERAEPDAVADSFLRAYLIERNDENAALYTCGADADLTAISGLRNEALRREKNFDVKVSITWSSLTVGQVGQGRADVDADLTIAGSSNGTPVSRRTETWSVGLVDNDGWRVCSATEKS